MPREYTFDTGAVVLNYAEYADGAASGGAGGPLMLLHGGSARWQSAMPIIADLARQRRLYAPDFRGHGQSGWTPGHYTLRDYVADTRAFLQEVVGEPAVLMGHSLGGQVALMLAAEQPALVKGLIIGDAPLDIAPHRTLIRWNQDRLLYWQALAGGTRADEEIVEALKNTPLIVGDSPTPVPARAHLGEDSGWYEYMMANLRGHDPAMLDAVVEFEHMHAGYEAERLLPAIMCPVLILRANPALGGMLTDAEITAAYRLLPDLTVADIAEVGHELYTREATEVLPAVLSFLERW